MLVLSSSPWTLVCHHGSSCQGQCRISIILFQYDEISFSIRCLNALDLPRLQKWWEKAEARLKRWFFTEWTLITKCFRPFAECVKNLSWDKTTKTISRMCIKGKIHLTGGSGETPTTEAFSEVWLHLETKITMWDGKMSMSTYWKQFENANLHGGHFFRRGTGSIKAKIIWPSWLEFTACYT